jgi:hypothetical protein
MRRTLSLLTLSITLSTSAFAGESLYDGANAEAAAPEHQNQLGPKSAGVRYDERMIRAAKIAQQRAFKKPTWKCWRYVKDALLAANVVSSRPSTVWAKQAGKELTSRYGFTRLRISDPYDAPVGAVIVYGGADAGHVELRTSRGFVSDFSSKRAYPRPLLGVYVKPAQS